MLKHTLVFVWLLLAPLFGPIFGAGAMLGATFGVATAQTERNASALVSNAPKTQRRVALVIGNSAYPSSALENPRHDAAAMTAALKNLQFEVEPLIDATKAQLDAALRRFGNRAEDAEVAAVFYAGHGIQVNGVNYLVPIDAKPQSERDLKRDMVKLDDIIEDMGKAKVKLVFFDACRDNPLARSFNRSNATRGLAPPTEASGTLISFATKHGNTAADGEGKSSPYTQALVAELANPNGVEIEVLLKNVSRAVKGKTRGQQEPWKYGSLDADFYLIFNAPVNVTVQAPPTDPETETWKAAESVNQADAYQAYLDAYPNGRFAAPARIKLKALKTGATVAPAPTFAPAAQDDGETMFWNDVKSNGAREYLEAYLKQYPKGKFVAFARLELKKLDERDKAERAKLEAEKQQALERERQEAQRSEQAVWERAKAEDTVTAYVGYLRDYPKGRYAMLAEAGKQKLQREAAERERQEAAQAAAEKRSAEERRRKEAIEAAALAETTAWQACVTEENCRRYLSDYPKGKYAAQAKAEIERLRRVEAEEKRAAAERERRETAERLQREAREREEAREAAAQRKAAAEVRPSKVFKDCSDCPEMVVIPAGSFEMGSNENFTGNAEWDARYKPVHTVRVKTFALAKTEVTHGQWKAVMGNNPSDFKNCGDDCPVENVNWDDAQAYVRKLSEKTGKRYRLPSEAEWEYACRAGGNHSYCGGNDIGAVAWYNGNSGSKTHAVAGKQANAFGLYDMSGNVWEWTEDCWNANYTGAPSDGSAWMTGECARRVRRGGSWNGNPQVSRAALRIRNDSSLRGSSLLGFRPARMLP